MAITISLVEQGPSLGFYRGREIPDYLRYSDNLFGRFVGIAPTTENGLVNLDSLDDDEFVVCPGLIYRVETW